LVAYWKGAECTVTWNLPKNGRAKALVAHSGGPTPVINASLLGVVEEARRQQEIGALYGAVNGMQGVLSGEFLDLLAQNEATLQAVSRTPGSALGSSRKEIGPRELERVLDIFRAHEIRYFFYTGGNGSMGTASQLAAMARDACMELAVIGIPKTIDNDLAEIDHTPGYATAARFFACAVRDIDADNRSLPGQVEFVEVLGRNAGWLVAATALARHKADDAPHLIYLPENRLPLSRLLDDVDRVYRRLGRCVVAVCEGQLDENGEPFGADVRPGSRATLAMNLAHRLAMLVTQHLKIRARSEKPGILGRASMAELSTRDWEESRLCGQMAVRHACGGASDVMVTLVREPAAEYAISTGLAALDRVAYVERLVPSDWISAGGNDVTEEFRRYAGPLVGSIARHERLE
jgi:ATP-dependent phosphofructokinase / diphosphate-dependent phosphofructokinase